MKYYICFKPKDGEVIIREVDKEIIDEIKSKHYKHLCASCKCISSDKNMCIKVLDYEKKNIGKYIFIEEGIQLIKSETPISKDDFYTMDDIIRFYVTGCDNYSVGDPIRVSSQQTRAYGERVDLTPTVKKCLSLNKEKSKCKEK